MDHTGRIAGWLLVGLTAFLATAVIALVVTVPVTASSSSGTGAVSGVVFFDGDGDGLLAVNGSERGIPAATVQLIGPGNAFTTTTDANGVYTFTALAPSGYTVALQPPTGYVTTTSASAAVSVGSGPVAGPNFALAYPISIYGTVCQDLNGDGQCALPAAEPRIAGALVQVFHDANRNGLLDLGEALIGSATSDAKGLYLISALRPGSHIVILRLPGGAESSVQTLSLQSDEAGAATVLQNFAVGQAAIEGVVFHDVNGNEFPDAGETPLRSAVVQLLAAAGGQAVSPVTIVATATTDIDGRYAFAKLPVAAYQVRVMAPVPVGWLQSSDPSALIPSLQPNIVATANIGFFDPASVPPMSLADWKRELRQSDQWAYTAAEQQTFVNSAQTVSRVFSETVALRDALLLGGATTFSTEKWRALKEHAALLLNIASLRLRPETLVKLGTLSGAITVRQARDEIEALLLSAIAADHMRALAIAQALNAGQGVGIGLTGISAVTDALYQNAQVASKLKLGGDIVEVRLSNALTLRKWSAGAYKSTTNVLKPQLRIRVKSFNQGGTLEVTQRFPDGRSIKLGTLRSNIQNRDVNRVFLLNLSRITTIAELTQTTLILTVRDIDGGKPASVKIDSTEISFSY